MKCLILQAEADVAPLYLMMRQRLSAIKLPSTPYRQENSNAIAFANGHGTSYLPLLLPYRRGTMLTTILVKEISMADLEQVRLLMCSIQEWNRWRQEYPETRADLRNVPLSGTILCDADLSSADLSGANLSSANLSRADLRSASLREATLDGAILNSTLLSKADLSGADLNSANLSVANLRGATLNYATMCYANLNGAILSNASLAGADLTGVCFSRTTLDHTNFHQACFTLTVFAWVDLSLAKGLETALYRGPSCVDINSVIFPHDEQTCLHFLRGVGFTETQIEYLPSLLTPRPIEHSSLFISYASQDDTIARQLHADLRKRDVRCWFAPHDLQPGNYFRECIDQAIYTQDKLLLLLSEYSLSSAWVRYEVELALARENDQQREILFPLRLDDAIFHCTTGWARSLRSTRHIGDFTGWRDDATYQGALATLLRHLEVAQSSEPIALPHVQMLHV